MSLEILTQTPCMVGVYLKSFLRIPLTNPYETSRLLVAELGPINHSLRIERGCFPNSGEVGDAKRGWIRGNGA
jgi:hypothetical protein